jgi:hypothetical protein
MTIWKYPIPSSLLIKVLMPEGAQIVHVHAQHEDICMWALVDEMKPTVTRFFAAFGTGDIVAKRTMHYVGSAHLQDGHFTMHVFEIEQDELIAKSAVPVKTITNVPAYGD